MTTNYFRNFPEIDYIFGNELNASKFENISIYSDVVDQVKNVVTAYEDYNIYPGERPDQVSFNLYGTTEHYWTFYLMNDKLREQGWPLSNKALEDWATKNYNEIIVNTQTTLTDRFAIGTTVKGYTSEITGTVIHRDLDLGQLWFYGDSLFTVGESIFSTNTDPVETITVLSCEKRITATHHYEDESGNHWDIDPTAARPGDKTAITWQDRLIKQNDNLKTISVIKTESINDIVESFKEAIRI